VYFSADDGTHSYELWRTNGTEAGTTMVKDIYPSDNNGSDPQGLTEKNGFLYFSALDAMNGQEPWRTDGTEAGTTMVKDIRSGANNSYSQYFTALGNYACFQANDGTHGVELWCTDGTEADTKMVKDINTTEGWGGNSSPLGFTELNGYLYFNALDGNHMEELWRTDGTEAGTTIVKDINGFGHSSPSGFTALGSYLYFSASDGRHGYEFFRTDGTEGGTEIVADLNPGGSSNVNSLVAFNGAIYFQADDGVHGTELWRSDGTNSGTMLPTDINATDGGLGSSAPSHPVVLGDFLYFDAYDGVHGTELWRTNGSITERVPFPAGEWIECDSCGTVITTAGSHLFTIAVSESIGWEFAYLNEPTAGLPPTDRSGFSWTTAFVVLAGLTAAAGIGLRVRDAMRA
jgi:ELWxxDGT repeat protein